MNKQKNKSISVRGETYEKLKAYADKVGSTPGKVVQQWLQEYKPFGEDRPKPRLILVTKTKTKSKPKPKPKPTGGGYHEF